LYDNHVPAKDSEKPAHKRRQAFLATLDTNAIFKQLAAVHNSMLVVTKVQRAF
jgi:hypothetical protein